MSPAGVVAFGVPEDPQITAARLVAESNHAIAKAISDATATLGPAADTIHGFGARLDGLCRFLTRRGPWILGSMPLVLTTIGAITPDAAKALHNLLVGFGAPVR